MQLLWAIEGISEVKAFDNVMKIKHNKLKIFKYLETLYS